MIARLGTALNRLARRFMPDPFLFALLLTLATVLLAMTVAGRSLGEVLLAWRGNPDWDRGFWSLLAFSMQMCLILVTGHALAMAVPVRSVLRRLAGVPRTTGGAAALISLVSMLAALVNWGFGLIVGAVLARETGRSARARGLRFHYPLLAAAGYTGLMVWHGGLSGSAPLKVVEAGIPLQATLGTTFNLALAGALLAAVPTILFFMAPHREEEILEIPPELCAEPPEPAAPGERSFASRMENSRVLTGLACGMAAAVLGYGFGRSGLGFLDLGSVPFLFLFLGLALHTRPIRYVAAVTEAARGCAGILLQFPFYAGIAGILTGTGSGRILSLWFADHSTPATFPLMTFLSASIVNLFVPSGGGQWAVQGQVMLDAASRLGVEPGRVVMGVAYGDEYTNMVQPFWALALLGITGLQARDMIGYSAAVMLLCFPLFAAAVTLL